MTEIEHYLAVAQPYLQDYGYAAVFTVMFLESFGLPLPGESLLIASALLASQGDLRIVPLLGSVWAAAVLGDNVGYAIGHFGGRRLIVRYGSHLGLTEPRLARVESFFGRYGAEVVLAARFFVLLRQLNGITAGTLAMPWRRFLFYNALGGALWTLAWGLGVYFLGRDVADLLPWIRRIGYGVLAAVGLAGLVMLTIWYARRQRPS
jgi:membrane protein DedA with SNARE-associated domain